MGGNRNAESLRQCFELLLSHGNTKTFEKRDMNSLIFERTLSSVCALGSKSLVVTGSFVSYSRNKAE